MVTCQSSELSWEVTVELPADFLSLGRGSVKLSRLTCAGSFSTTDFVSRLFLVVLQVFGNLRHHIMLGIVIVMFYAEFV